MEIIAESASDAFIKILEALVAEHKIYGLTVRFKTGLKSDADKRIEKVFDCAFDGKTAFKGGRELCWREWLLNSGFPVMLYELNGMSLKKLAVDERLCDINYRSRATFHSFYGRLSRAHSYGSLLERKSFVDFLFERWSDKSKRAYPNYYFDVAPASWIWEELIQNKRQVKTGRAAAVCATNMYFRWDKNKDMPIHGWVLKHSIFTHVYQDIYSPQAIAMSVGNELGIDKDWEIVVFFVSLYLDSAKRAKKILEGI